MPLSTSPALRILATVLGTVPIGFGINAFLNPWSALSFFELALPATDSNVAEALLIVYGARDIFMGLAV